MAKTLYKADFSDKLPLGGIATGHINFCNNGSVLCDFSPHFAIKAEKEGQLTDARILQSTSLAGSDAPYFEKSEAFSHFPFAEIILSDSSFPADVKMSAFSPFIPLNDTDSGIPAVSFTFEITNRCSERLDFSVACHSQNTSESPYNRMGCTDTGEAYVFLSSDTELSSNFCISTNGKNVSFCEYTESFADFWKNFIENTTLYNKTKSCVSSSFAGSALSTHFSLGENESTKVSFCISWYNSENAFSRNYYAQYFESSLEFSSTVFSSTLPGNALEEVNRDLFSLIGKDLLRLDDGTLVTEEKEAFTGLSQFISRQSSLSNLFPALDYSKTLHFYKSGLYENAKQEELLLAILSSYRKFLLSGDTDALIEDWYYVAKCLEKLYGENAEIECPADDFLQNSAIEAVCVMAEAVKDKKRLELYSEKLLACPLVQFSMDISYGFAKLYEYQGFGYSAKDSSISFNPLSDICPLDDGGTFKCFFCTPQGFGYVEEGIDYIEINLLSGKLGIRSFGVPRTPRLVQYVSQNKVRR